EGRRPRRAADRGARVVRRTAGGQSGAVSGPRAERNGIQRRRPRGSGRATPVVADRTGLGRGAGARQPGAGEWPRGVQRERLVAALAAAFMVPRAGRRRGRAPGVGLVHPPPAEMSPAAFHTVLLLAAALTVSVLRLLPDFLTFLLMLASWVVSGIVPARVAARGS